MIQLGFEVYFEKNLDVRSFVNAVSRFANNLQDTDAGVFYYAGHGAQVNGDNFLIPIGCEPSNSLDLETGAVKLQTLLDTLGNASFTSVFFLDCCRNNPLPRWAAKGVAGRALTLSRGLASPTLPNGSFIAFSTMNDAVAEDGEGDNSVFTANLCKLITLPDTSISNVMAKVRGAVRAATFNRQMPMEWTTLIEPYVFNLKGGPINDRMDSEDEYWTYVKDAKSLELLQSFILRFPSGKYRPAAIRKIDELKHIKWKQEAWVNTGKIVAIAIAIAFVVLYVSWIQFTVVEKVDLVGADIYTPVDPATTEQVHSSYFGYFQCKLSCIASRSCVAFTFDRSPKEEDRNKKRNACYLKNDYSSFQSKGETHTSGYIAKPWFISNFQKETKLVNDYDYQFSRVYNGKTINVDGTSQDKIDHTGIRAQEWQLGKLIAELVKERNIPIKAKKFRHGFTFCKNLCDANLNCCAFSYSSAHKRCKLLQKGATEFKPLDGMQLVFASVIVGVTRDNRKDCGD